METSTSRKVSQQILPQPLHPAAEANLRVQSLNVIGNQLAADSLGDSKINFKSPSKNTADANEVKEERSSQDERSKRANN